MNLYVLVPLYGVFCFCLGAATLAYVQRQERHRREVLDERRKHEQASAALARIGDQR